MKSDKLIDVWTQYVAYAQAKGFDLLSKVGVGQPEYALVFGKDEIKIDYQKQAVRFKPDSEWIKMNEDMINIPKSMVEWGALVFRNSGVKTDADGTPLAEVEVILGTGSPFSPMIDNKENGIPRQGEFLVMAPAKAMIKV